MPACARQPANPPLLPAPAGVPFAPPDHPGVSALHVLQLLASVPLAMLSGVNDTAARTASAVIDWVWLWDAPDSNLPLQHQLSQHGHVPFWPSPEDRVAAQQAERRAPSTALARELAALLQRHCPGTSLGDLRRWALMLRCTNGGRLRRPEAGDQQLQALMDYQVLLASPSTPSLVALGCATPCITLAESAGSWLPNGGSPDRRERLAAFARDALARAEAEHCEQGRPVPPQAGLGGPHEPARSPARGRVHAPRCERCRAAPLTVRPLVAHVR